MDAQERYEMMMRDVSFRAYHYRSMARMMELILILQLFIAALTFHPERWRAHWWLAVVQVGSFGFALFMLGRTWRDYRRRAQKLGELEKAMIQFGRSQNENQFEAAQEQVQAALKNL